MNKSISLYQRRIGVAVNLIAIILFVFVFELIRYPAVIGKTIGLILMGALFVTLVISFYYVFGSTGTWKMSHQQMENLDEREVQVLSNAIRLSYSFFVIITLLIIYGYALLRNGPIDVVIAGALLYLAHILPASIITWTEKII